MICLFFSCFVCLCFSIVWCCFLGEVGWGGGEFGLLFFLFFCVFFVCVCVCVCFESFGGLFSSRGSGILLLCGVFQYYLGFRRAEWLLFSFVFV